MAIGAVAGGAAGAATGKGHERGRNAVIGAVAGGVAGNRIGAYMDRQEAELRQSLEGTGVRVVRNGDRIDLEMPGDITFATGSSKIDDQFEPVLEGVGDVLQRYGETGVKIQGFTDNTGSAETNKLLSEQRANSVASFLEKQGIDDQRIGVEGYGESQPKVSNATAEGRSKNRRVEIQLYPIAH